MFIATLQIKLYAPWVHSLKEKRMVVKSLLGKLSHQFNVSVGEIGSQDIHQIIEIGTASIVANRQIGDSTLDHILTFIEDNTEAQMTEILRDII